MNKFLLFISILGISLSSFGQTVIFSEDFSAGMPASIILHNVDGLTPNANVSFVTDAWVERDEYAVSTSWYNPIGQSDDWMVIPGIAIVNSGTFLTWTAFSPDASFTDGYEVYVSTTGTNPADFTTTVYTTTAATNDEELQTADLSSYAGQTVNIAFRNNSNDKFLLYVDNIKVTELDPVDAELSNVNVDNFVLAPGNVTITGTVTNFGATALTAFDVEWTDGVNTYTESITGQNIPPFGTYDFTHSTSVNVSTADVTEIDVTVIAAGDANSGNNVLSDYVSGMSNIPAKTVFGEEATGTWCQWCPRGDVWMNTMANDHPTDWIGVAVHNSDPMENTDYDTWMGAQIGGYPSGVVDREILDVDPSTFKTHYNTQKGKYAPGTVTVTPTWNETSRDITMLITADFEAGTRGDIRVAGIIVEDNVTGTTSGYNQSNAYAGGASGVMGGYELLPNPVPAADMVYNHVGRELLGGINGDMNSLPASINSGESHTHTYTFNLPTSMDENEIQLVALLIDPKSGIVLNAGSEYLIEKANTSIEAFENATQINVSPNPFIGTTNVSLKLEENTEVSMEVFSVNGQMVASRDYGQLNGSQILPFDASELNAGIYILKINVGGEIITKRVISQK